ncbi:MAG: DUF488 domain-containing protein [Candidatus Omnitrophica bacterium]|nr:DUF488 domain-containing protein [Candidatus Omnitrophota bacterium]MDD5611003.1 DUF488 domain-containing protein [Candidatus Omnitrophota bacterium]
MKKIIFAVGYSTRTAEQFIALLKAHGIKQLVDIRTIPRSRFNPQFNKDALAKSLRNVKIGYRHLKELGGLRHAKKDSINLGWENLSFRGFADYMGTQEFKTALAKLKKIAGKKRTAIMCVEGNPFRCHRSLIADALIKEKWQVFHIASLKSKKLHRLTSFLRIRKGKIIYPKINT